MYFFCKSIDIFQVVFYNIFEVGTRQYRVLTNINFKEDIMYKIRPYTSTTRDLDLFDVFDNFFGNTRNYGGNMKIDVQNLEKVFAS